MEPDARFSDEAPEFWALVRYTSEQLGYSKRRTKNNPNAGLKRHSAEDILQRAEDANLSAEVAERVHYLEHRADVLDNQVQHLLMDRSQAKQEFKKLKQQHHPACHLPMNKQSGKKRHPNYLNCIVNMLAEHHLGGRDFIDNPGQLATITDTEDRLVKTLSRRIDGAYPGLHDPVAIWEVKEYYGTTSFGSRVSGGVYETQLDGYELNEAERLVDHEIEHYLFVDDKRTWWGDGRSYLCRLVDAAHMGLVDEVIYGEEVLERWPQIVEAWSKQPTK